MKTYKCKLKSRKQMEADIPRDRWGWWIDISPGKTLELRKATESDLARCPLEKNDDRTAKDFLCELGNHGSLVSKEAVEYVQMPPDVIGWTPAIGDLSVEESITGVDRPSDTELLRRAVKYVRAEHGNIGNPRWSFLKDIFSVGSTTSTILCQEAGVDPYEMLYGGYCEGCPWDEENRDEEDEVDHG